MYKIKNGVKGFTLLELLVVVLIIGILAAIALPQYQMAVAKSKFATLKNNVRALYEAEQRYYLLHGTYALTNEGLDIDLPSCKFNSCCSSSNTNPYVSCTGFTINGVYVNLFKWMVGGKNTCYTREANNMQHITHRLCQAESGKKTPSYCSSDNCQYHWY